MKKGKILVVDDNQGIRSALKILLPAHFAEVEIIASPKSLVTTMESFRPDVVLLDMNFYTDINTGNEGLYWTGELKKMWPEVQIVLLHLPQRSCWERPARTRWRSHRGRKWLGRCEPLRRSRS
ncbi:MAG: response regulator [Caryophanon sp.]|nr:response regulator [Caryophanon sp.]